MGCACVTWERSDRVASNPNGRLGQRGRHALHLVAMAPFSVYGIATCQRDTRVSMEQASKNNHVTRAHVLRNGATGARVLSRARRVCLVKSSVARNLAVALAWAMRVVRAWPPNNPENAAKCAPSLVRRQTPSTTVRDTVSASLPPNGDARKPLRAGTDNI